MDWTCATCGKTNAPAWSHCQECSLPRGASPARLLVARAVDTLPAEQVLVARAVEPGAAAAVMEPSEAALAMKLAVASWFCCGPITAVPAIFMSLREKRRIDAGARPEENRDKANSAFWIAVANLAAALVYAVFMVGVMRGA